MFSIAEMNKHEESKRKQLSEMPVSKTTPLSVLPVDVTSPQPPVLKTLSPEEIAQSQRNNYMQSFNTWAEAEKRGDISQKDWANAKIQEKVAKGENPGDYLTMLEWMGDAETPEQKRKRERREALGETFRGLGNLIGSAANLYNTAKGGQYIDLNTVNERHRARMERLREKQDVLKQRQDEMLGRAMLSDIQAGRAERAAKAKADADYKRDLALKQIEHAFRIGQIDAQAAANMKMEVARLKTSKELEDYRQKNRESLAESNHQRIIEREEARGGGSRATIRVPRIGGSGYDEYRKNDLKDETVVSTIYYSLPEEYRIGDSESNPPTLIKMKAAIGKALYDGAITEIAPEIKVNGKQGGGSKTPPSKRKNDEKVPPSKRTK